MIFRLTLEVIGLVNLEPCAVVGQIDALSVWPEESSIPLTGLLWGLGVVALVAGVWLARAVWGRLWARLGPLRLFWHVAGRAGLSAGERWLLWRAARGCGLRTPLTLLVCRATLMHHAAAWTERLPHGRALHAERRLHGVGKKLFPEPSAG